MSGQSPSASPSGPQVALVKFTESVGLTLIARDIHRITLRLPDRSVCCCLPQGCPLRNGIWFVNCGQA